MVDLTDFPTISAYLAAQGNTAPQGPPPNTTGNLFTSALKSGAYGAASDLAGAVAAGAKAVGYDTGATNAQTRAAGYAQQAQAAGRSDIEGQGFFSNGLGGFAKKTAYEVTKQLPVLGAAIAAAPLAPEIAEGSLAARAAGAIGSRIGSEEAGGVLARHILGGAAVTVPQAIGANYEAANAQPGGATRGDALKSIALGLPVGFAQAIVPSNALGLKAGATTAQRVANSAFGNAAAGAVGSGLGAAATLSFDPSKSAGDKASEIVNAAVSGGAFGGLFGGAFGLLGGHGPADAPSRATNADLASTVDAATGQRNGQGAGVGAPATVADPRTPIEAQTLPQGQGGGLPPLPQPAALPEGGLIAQLLRDRFGGEPQGLDQTALLDRFMARPPEPGEVQGPAPLLALPKPALRLTDQRAGREVPVEPTGPDIPLPDRSGSTPDENYLPRYDAIRLPDRSDVPLDQGAFEPEQRTLPVDTQRAYIQRLEEIRQQQAAQPQTGRDIVPYTDPAMRVEPWWRSSPDERVNASPTLGPEDAPNPHTQTPLDIDPATGVVRRFTRDELYDPAIGAPRGDAPLPRLGSEDDAAALARDRARLKALFPDRGTTPADAAPRSIAERVTDAAHDLTGGTGGEAKIADIRKALPDLASADIDNALRQIHGDDSDNTLTQAPKGQRKDVDGVTVSGQGRFHNLSVEARDGSRVQERSAASEIAGDRPGSLPADGGADPARSDPARASADPGTTEGRAGAADVLPRPEPTAQVGAAADQRQVLDRDGNPVPVDTRDLSAQFGRPPREERALAAAPLTSYRYPGRYQDMTAGATSHADALRQLKRGTSMELDPAKLDVHDGTRYVPATAENDPGNRPQVPRNSKAALQTRSKALVARNIESGTSPVRSKVSLSPVTDLAARKQAQRDSEEAAFQARRIDQANRETQARADRLSIIDAKPREVLKGSLVRPGDHPIGAARQDLRDYVNGLSDADYKLLRRGYNDRLNGEIGNTLEPEKTLANFKNEIALGKAGVTEQSGAARAATEARTNAAKDANAAGAVLQRPGPDPVKPKAIWGGQGASVLPREEVQGHFNDIVKGIKAEYASKVHLVDNAEALPLAIRQQAAKQGLDLRQVAGMYHRGEAYIVADKQTSRADVEDVVSHEVFGHLATEARVRELYGPDATRGNFEASMADAFDRAGGTTGIEKIARELGVWDKDGRGGTGVGLRGYLPDDVANLSTHRKAVLLDELIAHAASATEIGPKQQALMAYVGRIKTVIADALRKAGLNDFAAKFDRFDANDVAKWIADSREALSEPAPKDGLDLASLGDDRLRFQDGGASRDLIKPKLIRAQADEAGGVTNLMGKLSDHLNLLTSERTLQSGFDILRSGYGFKRAFKGFFAKHWDAGEQRGTIEAQVGLVHSSVNAPTTDFIARYPEAGRMLNQVKQDATTYNLDPLKSWEDHTWHRDAADRTFLKARYDDMTRDYNKLGQQIGKAPAGQGQELYRQAAALGRGDRAGEKLGQLVTDMDTLLKGEKLAGFERDVGEDFSNTPAAHSDPVAYERFMRGELDKRLKGLDDYLQNAKDDPALADVKRSRDGIKDALDRSEQGAYFNLGRHGDFALSTRIKTDENGPVRASTDAIRTALDAAGFKDVAISHLNDNADLFMRVETPEQLRSLRDVFEKLSDGDHLEKEIRQFDVNTGKGLDGSADFNIDDAPALKKLLAKGAAAYAGANDVALAKHLGMLRSTYLDTLSNLSLAKVNQERKLVQGYDTRQHYNDIYRGQVAARAISTLLTGPKTLEAATGLTQLVKDAQLGRDTRQSLLTADRVKGYFDRNAASQVRVPNSFLDAASKFVHAFYIGMSPSYFIMQLTQIPTLVLPQLGSRYGYAASAAALTRNLPAAGRVLAQIVKQGGLTGGVTSKVLEEAGLNKGQVEALQQASNSGRLEIGSFARMMQPDIAPRGQIGSVYNKALRLSNGTATLSEVAGRLVTVLAAHDLHTSDPAKAGKFASKSDYVNHVLDNGMLTWGSHDTPRYATQGGPLGQFGPIAFQFHQFSTKLAEKILHEAHNGFVAGGEDAATSRKFLAGHAAAVVALAGGLGLPAAGWMAAAINRGTGLFNDGEGYDVEAHFRDWLASVVGKDTEEVLSRGIPRYLGADMSELGDNSFLPFQRLLEDHRSFKDAMTSYLASSWGSTPGVALNAVAALTSIKNGQILDGLTKVLPAAILRNGVKAYQLSDRGYVNSKGERMPLSVSASDIIARALGYEPGQQANYADRADTIENANEDRRAHAGVIKQQLAIAIERGDKSARDSWMAAARTYDQDPDHRGEPILPSFDGYLASRANAVAYARKTGMPLGTSPKDLPALNLANY